MDSVSRWPCDNGNRASERCWAAIPQVLDWQWTSLGAYPSQAGAAAPA